MWQSNAYSAKSQLQPGGNRTVLRRNCLSSAAACRRIPWSTDRFRNLYQVLSYLNRIIEPSFSVVNTLFALLTHLHEFLEANWGFTYTIITGARYRYCVENRSCLALREPGALWFITDSRYRNCVKNRNCLALCEPGALWFITGSRYRNCVKNRVCLALCELGGLSAL